MPQDHLGITIVLKDIAMRLQNAEAFRPVVTAQREADELRAQLSLIKGIDVQSLLQSAQASTPEMLDEYVRNATAALVALQPPKARTEGDGAGGVRGAKVAAKAGAPSVRPARKKRRDVEERPGSNLGAHAIGSVPMRDEL